MPFVTSSQIHPIDFQSCMISFAFVKSKLSYRRNYWPFALTELVLFMYLCICFDFFFSSFLQDKQKKELGLLHVCIKRMAIASRWQWSCLTPLL